MFYSGMMINLFNLNKFSFTAKTNKVPKPLNALSNPVESKKETLIPASNFHQFMMKTKPVNTNKLSIYYYNDTHGNSDSMADVINNAKRFQEKAKVTNDTTFILSAGDNCSGADVKKNGFIFDLMQNIMGVELSAVGNHEVDATGSGFYEAAKDKNITFVATNVRFYDDNEMSKFVKKSIIKEKNGVKYGFVGAMPIDFEMCTKEASQKGVDVFDFEHTVSALQSEINNLKAKGVNRIIMLSHIGYDADKKLVKELDGVDIVIGGHTHSVVEGAKKNENVLTSKSGEPVIITQGGENGNYYGVLNVEFDENGVLTKVQNNLTASTNKSKSPVIEYVKNQGLGISPHIATISEIDPMPKNRRIVPCAWTEVMADSIKEELGVDIAIINSANTRKVPSAGNLTQRDISESAPMKNNLLKVKITQKQLIDAVKNAALNTMAATDGYPGLIQGSGFTYKIDSNGQLLEFNIKDKNGNLIPVDINNPSENITYTAAYDNFVAKKGGETPELEPKFGFEEYDFDKDYTLSQYLSKRKDKENLVIKDDNRLEIVQTSKQQPQGSNIRKI